MNAKCRHHRANKKNKEMLPLKVLEMVIAPTQNQLHETHAFVPLCTYLQSVKRMFKQNMLIHMYDNSMQ